MKKCFICGSELPEEFMTDKCLDCSRRELMEILQKNTEIKKAFDETLQELNKPGNIEGATKSITGVIDKILKVKQKREN